MDLNTFIKLSPATLNVFDSVVIMFLIPVVDRVLYPALARCGVQLSMVTKIAIGFSFAGLSVVCAGVTEIARKHSEIIPGALGESPCPGGQPMTSFSIWWQTPQYMLIGLGEVFAAITCYELFYSEVPPHMRSVCQSINLLCTAFGSLAAAGFNSIMQGWIPQNLNEGKLENVFFVLAVLMAVNIAAFKLLSANFDHRAPELDPVASRGVDESFASFADDLERDLRMSGTGPLAFLEPGVLLGGRRSRMSSNGPSRSGTYSTRRTTGTDAPSVAEDDHLEQALLARESAASRL